VIEKLVELYPKIVENYRIVEKRLTDPDVLEDPNLLKEYSKKHARYYELVQAFQELENLEKELEELKEMEEDPEMMEMVEEEKKQLLERRERLIPKIKILLLPESPNDSKDVILEIRAAAGGEEAALFAADLFRMYLKYAEKNGWKVELIDSTPTELGGFKEIVAEIKGKDVYRKMKYESGVHRVQRIPVTESGGRIHTSTATVAILPEADEIDISIDPSELRIDTFRASGHGGQHVNKTESAIRIVHIPTGITVTSQSERSQFQNKQKALMVLRSKLLNLMTMKENIERSKQRKIQIGTGERSEKIRTYNFPQNRVTDHRINFTLHNLQSVLDGDLDPIIEKLIETELEERLGEIEIES
jgi:peptide chain release factor 1